MTKHHLQARAAVLIVASALLVPTEAWAGSWYWSKDGTSPPCTDGTAKGVTGDGAWIGCSESNGGYKVWEEIGDPMNPWGGPYLENAIQIASDASYKDWVAGSGGKVKWFSGTSSWTEWTPTGPGGSFSAEWVAPWAPSSSSSNYDLWILDTFGNAYAVQAAESSSPNAEASLEQLVEGTELALFSPTISCDGGTMHTPFYIDSSNNIYEYNWTTGDCWAGKWTELTTSNGLGDATSGAAHIATNGIILGPAGYLFAWDVSLGEFKQFNGTSGLGPPSGVTFAGIGSSAASSQAVAAWDTSGNWYELLCTGTCTWP